MLWHEMSRQKSCDADTVAEDSHIYRETLASHVSWTNEGQPVLGFRHARGHPTLVTKFRKSSRKADESTLQEGKKPKTGLNV